MTLLPRLCRVAVLASLMAGCQPTTGTLPDGVTPNAVAGDAIEVMVLDSPAAAPAPVAGAAVPEAPAQGATPPTGSEDAVAVPAPIPATPAEAGAATDVPADVAPETTEAATDPATEAPAEAAPVVVPKSERQKACERKKGIWASTGGGLKVCVRKTSDSGKRCSRESDCDGVCLARSGTCAPADPMLGCNDVLQNDGSRATLCIE